MSSQKTTSLLLQNYPIHHLNEDERDHPLTVLQDFFSYAHLPEVRQWLWFFFKTTVTGNFPKNLTSKQRNDLVLLFEQLQKLVEAAHLINEARKADSTFD